MSAAPFEDQRSALAQSIAHVEATVDRHLAALDALDWLNAHTTPQTSTGDPR